MATTAKTEKVADKDEAKMTSAEMQAQIETLMEEIENLRNQLASSGERSFEALKSIANEGVNTAKAQGKAAMADLRESAGDIEEQLANTVREKPITSLAVAAGIGFLFAVISGR